jgi:hypothetical protein
MNDKIKDDVKAMLDALELGPSTSGTEPPSTDPPQDDIETDPPMDDDVTTDEPKTEPPSTDPPRDDDEISRLMRENREYKEKLEKLEKKPPTTEAPSTDPPIEDIDFTSDVDWEEVSDDPKKFNELLNKVRRDAIETARNEYKSFGSKTLQTIPDVVKKSITTQEQLKQLSIDFYEENEDLKPWKKTVAVVFDEMVSENPNETFGELLPKVGNEVRARLGLERQKTKSRSNDNDDPPPLKRKKGRSRVVSKQKERKGVASEIDAMNEALER